MTQVTAYNVSGRMPKKRNKVPFKIGDLVTGIDRSYKRSIYKMLSSTEDPDRGLFEFQSLGADVVQRWKDSHSSISQYQMTRKYKDFRLATVDELNESTRAQSRYALQKLLHKLEVLT